MSTEFYQFYFNTKVLFQPGIRLDFSTELDLLKVQKCLLICDPFFVENGEAQKIQQGVENAGGQVVGIFSDIPPNSELKIVQKCAEMAKSQGAEGLIVLGGGSAMDTAKAANILFSLGGDLVEDYSGTQTISQTLKPLIAIPTTAGTGSEATSSAVILDEANNAKLSFNDDYIRPTVALLDPELTLTLPPKITAMTGMDALTHAIESYTSLQANPMSDAMAMKAIELVRYNLVQAVETGDNLEARSNMLIAANLAGVAFDNAMVGVVHAVAHATGGVAHVPHGLANSIFLPFGMEYNLEVSAQRYADVAQRLGVETKDMSPEQAAEAAVQVVRELRAQMKQACGLADRFGEAAVQENQLESIAELAVEDGTTFYNPREVTYEDVLQKIKEAY